MNTFVGTFTSSDTCSSSKIRMGLAIDYIRSATLLQSECEKIEKLSDFLAPMTIAELFPALRELTRADKLKVMQFLIAELAREEEPALEPGATYLLWSPLNSHKAAHELAELLKSEQSTPNA